jgi:hypothetical protein
MALSDRYNATVLVGAVPRGGVPGTLYLIEPDPAEVATASIDCDFPDRRAPDDVRSDSLSEDQEPVIEPCTNYPSP